MSKIPIVIKVGGSLLTLKRLNDELAEFLEHLDTHRIVLLTGGGPAVKAYRQHCEKIKHPEEDAHWQCVKLMSDLTLSMSESFPNSIAVSCWSEVENAWEADRVPWFMVEQFLLADDKKKDRLPHHWNVSSDSIAAHLAVRHRAELILLKACALSRRKITASGLSKRGIVDPYFPKAARKLKTWSIRNLPGGTAAEIALDLLEPVKRVRRRRTPRPAPRSRRAARASSKPARRQK